MKSPSTLPQNEVQLLAALPDLSNLTIPSSQQLIRARDIRYISQIPSGDYQIDGLRSWCSKKEMPLANGQKLVYFSTKHRPAGCGCGSAEVMYIADSKNDFVAALAFKSSHEDAEFGIYNHSVLRASDGNILLARKDSIESFGMFKDGLQVTPYSDSSIKESSSEITENGKNIIRNFASLTDFLRQRTTPKTPLVAIDRNGMKLPARLAAPDFTPAELRHFMDFVPTNAEGHKSISTNGVEVFLNGLTGKISVNRGSLPSGDMSPGVYNEISMTEFFNNLSAGKNEPATSGLGKETVQELSRNRNSFLTNILFSIREPGDFDRFLQEQGFENLSRKFVDANGRNVLHHLVESAKDEESIARVNGFLDVLTARISPAQMQELALAGDAFHFKTPFSIAACDPKLSDLTARLIPFVGKECINQLDANGNTPLHWAVLKNSSDNSNLATIGNLIKAGANPDIIDSSPNPQNAVMVAFGNEIGSQVSASGVGRVRAGQSFSRSSSSVSTLRNRSQERTTEVSEDQKCLPVILFASLIKKLETKLTPTKEASGKFYKKIVEQNASGPSDRNLAFGYSTYSKSPYLEFSDPSNPLATLHLVIKDDGKIGLYRNETGHEKTEIEGTDSKSLAKLIFDISKKSKITDLGGVSCDTPLGIGTGAIGR